MKRYKLSSRAAQRGSLTIAGMLLAGLAAAWFIRLAPSPEHAAPAGVVTAGIADRDVTGLTLPPLAIGGAFALVDSQGRSVTQASFPGRWLLVYFGYTTCPDVCPTTLQTIADALGHQGATADRLAPVFITIDPARDSPQVVGRYAALFSPRLVGLSGSAAQIEAAEHSYRVYAARVDQPGTTAYLMNHTSFTYLMTPHGTLAAMFDRDVTADAMAATLRKALG